MSSSWWGRWLMQRVSAAYMALFTPAALLLLAPAEGDAGWGALFGHPLFALGAALFAIALLYHAWIGVRDVILDYVKPAGLRILLDALLALWLLALSLWTGVILVRPFV